MNEGKKLFGFDRLRERAIEELVAEMEWLEQEERGCESQIEKLLLAAMVIVSRFGFTEYTLLTAKDEAQAGRHMTGPSDPCDTLIIQPQAKLGSRRVDFVIYAYDWRDQDRDKWKWRKLLVECDGHDYHERTKEQAARDRSKDRRATLDGYDCFRFTGSEIWRDPWDCALQVFEWAAQGWG